MDEAGLAAHPSWEVLGDFTPRGGLAAMRLLLDADPRPTAVFAASDEMAVGAVHAVREAGLRVPEDVSVIGIDDHEMAEFFGLSTVAQPVHEQGQLAGEAPARGARQTASDGSCDRASSPCRPDSSCDATTGPAPVALRPRA